jgi:hypothetical protein
MEQKTRMEAPYTIEFTRYIEGRIEPIIISSVLSEDEIHRTLPAVIRYAETLPPPAQAESFQIRDNEGRIRYAAEIADAWRP